MLVASFAASLFGFLLLALSLPRHWRETMGERHLPSDLRTGLRIGGFSFLLASLVFAFFRDGPAFGVLLWTLLSAVSALTVAFMLAMRIKRR
ncbi:DUF3325 domain-containing protein [Methylocystis sp. 9N]|uniref:DUF3325 domain-containing protein n=1 Tax=Methylocystis borbori TaxID=3118750 RepID=A0ABU7XCA3_9HYPH